MTTAALTVNSRAAIVHLPLSHRVAVGIGTPFIGHKRPLIAVFLYTLKTHARYLRRCLSIMVGCVGQPVKRLAGAYAGSSNPIQSTAQSLEPFDGGLSLFHRIKQMPHSSHTQNPLTQNPAINSVSHISLFNLFLHRQQIASNVSGYRALRIKLWNPSVIVKFVSMVGG